MNNIYLKEDLIPDIEDLANLYNDAGWCSYTNDLDVLKNALNNSLKVITAWDDNELVGLIRAVGDSYTILYIQDILVLKKYHRKGIGSLLMSNLVEKYKSVRQKVLMTDNHPDTVAFYTKIGFVPTETYQGIAFVKYNFS